jgi:hypothetical protein
MAKAGLFPFNPDRVLGDIQRPPAQLNVTKADKAIVLLEAGNTSVDLQAVLMLAVQNQDEAVVKLDGGALVKEFCFGIVIDCLQIPRESRDGKVIF